MARASHDDQFKAIGFPIMLFAFMIMVLVLTRKQLISMFKVTINSTVKWTYVTALVGAVFSMFFYVSSAWAYGLVSTVLCVYMAYIMSTDLLHSHGSFVCFLTLLWFLILVGVPANVSDGIVNAVSSGRCASWYGTKANDMCVDGWITFLLVLATIQISLTFLCVLSTLASTVGKSVHLDTANIGIGS